MDDCPQGHATVTSGIEDAPSPYLFPVAAADSREFLLCTYDIPLLRPEPLTRCMLYRVVVLTMLVTDLEYFVDRVEF